MKKIIYILIGLIMCGTVLYGEGYTENYPDEYKLGFNKILETGMEIENIGLYCYSIEDDERWENQVLAFAYNNNVYIIDNNMDKQKEHLMSFCGYSYIYGKDIFAIGVAGAPTGNHNRFVAVIKKNGNELKIVGVIGIGDRDMYECKSPGEDTNIWQMIDYDGDNKYEILLYSLELHGYLFVEINNDKLEIDYNPKNYLKIKNRIKNKKDYNVNMKFINKTINREKTGKVIKIINAEDNDKYIFKKIRGNGK